MAKKNIRILDKAKKNYTRRKKLCRTPGWIIIALGVLLLIVGFNYDVTGIAQIGGVLIGLGILLITFGDIILYTLFKK
jgi:hypothetical protein